MAIKNVVNFLLLRPAVTKRNLTSIGLVAVFFVVYVAAGGKITTMPQIERGGGFGAVAPAGNLPDVTGDVQREAPSVASPTTLPEPPAAVGVDSEDGRLQARPEQAISRSEEEKKKADNLAEIEARLKNLRKK